MRHLIAGVASGFQLVRHVLPLIVVRLCKIGDGRCPQMLLGADQQGRDMVSRLLFGLRATLMLGVTAVAVGGGIGATLGLLAAYYRRLDTPLMRFVDVLLSFPPILFGLAIAAVIGTGLNGLIVALCITAIPSIATPEKFSITIVIGTPISTKESPAFSTSLWLTRLGIVTRTTPLNAHSCNRQRCTSPTPGGKST